MSLDLYEKQLLRSISSIVAKDPHNAKLVFERVSGTTDNAVKIMAEIQPIVEVVMKSQQAIFNEHDHNQYFKALNVAIDQLDNNEAQVIFRSSLETDLVMEPAQSAMAAG